MSKKIFLFKSKYSFLSLILILIHQTLIALSVVFLTRIIQSFQNGQDFKNNLILYLFCMIFPYIPGLISFIFLQKWINYTHRKYLCYVYEKNNLTVMNLNQSDVKEKLGSLISRNSFQIINSTLYFFHDFLSLLLNSLLSIFIFYIILPSEIFIGYVLSFILSFILIVLTRKMIEKLYMNVELNMMDYGSYLNKFPENYAIDNKINKNKWLENSEKLGNLYYDSAYKAQFIKQNINLVLAMIAMIPTSYLVYSALISESMQASVIAAIVVNLTRIYTVLSSLNSVLSSFIEIPSIMGQLKVLFDMDFYNGCKNKATIKNIKINNHSFNSNEERVNYILKNNNGRFTIRGENGAGKTTFLNKLKYDIGDDAILVPTNLNNLIWDNSTDLDHLSTGQKIKRILNIVSNSDEKFLLLDEWDANLDVSNTEEINKILDALSLNKVIVEIRH
ncbi:ABC transporter ATP-binding protein [Acinetobacter gerneri]|uniref:ATP-binding cassette domain-containing protein n=1 Tax=Acinetobacter gerneri TaxID=202952 RepID=UPI003AF60C39